mmetsp:Transcript_128027/g.255648  ORF Transcript_128027/g.255648 Transcript_128027/m.255648 type:complete len:96 (-) Transcript_128027:40-327(-)
MHCQQLGRKLKGEEPQGLEVCSTVAEAAVRMAAAAVRAPASSLKVAALVHPAPSAWGAPPGAASRSAPAAMRSPGVTSLAGSAVQLHMQRPGQAD